MGVLSQRAHARDTYPTPPQFSTGKRRVRRVFGAPENVLMQVKLYGVASRLIKRARLGLCAASWSPRYLPTLGASIGEVDGTGKCKPRVG